MRLVDVVSPAPTAVWREVLAADPTAVVTQTPDWSACVSAVGPYRDASRLYVFEDGRRVVVPLARSGRLPRGVAPESSWPFDWGVGGPIADGPIGYGHSGAVYADLARRARVRVTMRTGPGADRAWTAAPAAFARMAYHSHVLDLAGGFEQVWSQRFRSSVRRAVRKAERSRLRVEVDESGRLVPVFDLLYRQSVQRWAAQQHEPLALARWRSRRANPVAKFHAVADRLGSRCAVWVAYDGDEPAAAIIVLRHGGHAKYWRGAMNAELASPLRANDLLHRLAIEAACNAGCHEYHMGESRPDSSLARFKAGFGARSCQGASYRLERVPLTAAQDRLRSVVKHALGFQDA